ncbi:MAG: tRNA adenosine deaminase-associated protein [Kineosporiaceae bacterium]|jgi:putative tRNA adenosine deaminase-associated protein
MSAVAYFTAVLARSGRIWRARDVEVDDAPTLDDLADSLRAVAVGDEPVLAVVEHEDEWFAIVRVDGEELPRLFVSDLAAASGSHYGALLAPAADVDTEADLDDVKDADDEEDDDEDDAPPEELEVVLAAWAGETDLLEDLGVPGRTLRKLVEDNADDPGAVLAEVGESVGFADLLEALR